MNQVSTRKEVARYLMLLKFSAQNWIEVKHRSCGADKNYDFMRHYGLVIEDVRTILNSLVVDDYAAGPCADDKHFGRADVWKFGKMVDLEDERVELYIKTAFGKRASGMGCICISIHPSEYPIYYPLRSK